MLEDDEYKRRMEEALDAAANVGSGSSALPEEGLDLEAIRALAAREQQTEVVPTFGDEAMAREAEAVAPRPAMRKPLVPKQATPAVGAKVPDEMDAAFAAASVPPADPMDEALRADARARNRQRREMAVRQLIAGLTRTQPVAAAALPPSRVDAERARQAQQAQLAAAAAGRDLAERRFEYQQGSEAERVKRDTSKLEFDRKRQAELDARAAAEKDEDQTITREGHAASQSNAAATRALAAAGLGIRREEHAAKEQERAEKREAGAVPLFDGVVTLNPGLGEAERNKARETAGLWNAADSATGELERALEAYVANPSRETAAAAQSAVATASTSLNAALGQGAMAEAEARRMQETLGADLFSPTGVEAAIRSFMGSPDAGKLLLTRLRSARQSNRAAAKARLRTYEAAQKPAPQAASSGTVRVRKGNDVLDIDASDLKAAQADGYEVVR